MKSIDYLTTEERVATATPFEPNHIDIGIKWTDDLTFRLPEEQEQEVNQLVTDIAGQTATRLVQFLIDDEPSDK